ncbi:hypothetical protein B0H10DRAFT_2438488 [Mycena sp. CBHHK59/15]|nr:hypothetical protein B0H10DRAFT_2438488 [Mycena sp. CBHHK59/15]
MPEIASARAPSRSVAVYCGADQPLNYDELVLEWDGRLGRAQMLPMPLESAPPPPKRQRKSNGCGALVHPAAAASQSRVWRAAEVKGSRVIVPLEDRYFTDDMRSTLLLSEQNCGCSRKGVGCSVCGNALGALFIPCTTHVIPPRRRPTNRSTPRIQGYYAFLPTAVSPPIESAPNNPEPVLPSRARRALERRETVPTEYFDNAPLFDLFPDESSRVPQRPRVSEAEDAYTVPARTADTEVRPRAARRADAVWGLREGANGGLMTGADGEGVAAADDDDWGWVLPLPIRLLGRSNVAEDALEHRSGFDSGRGQGGVI